VRRRVGIAAAVIGFAAALAGLLWLTAHFLAPPLFGVLSSGPRSPWAPMLLAALPAVIVGIPFGVAFGVLPWKRTARVALATAILAGCIDLATIVQAGIDPLGPRGWIYPIAEAGFVVLFVVAALAGRRASAHMGGTRRGWVGTWAWLVLATAACVAAAWSWERLMPHGVQ